MVSLPLIEHPPKVLHVFVGLDPREAVAYHTFTQSVLDNTDAHVAFHPLTARHMRRYGLEVKDGSNSFTYLRFLVPWIMRFAPGEWAIFADGDMLMRADIMELWRRRDYRKAMMVAQHDYQTKHPEKYLGNKNESYPRKNWSSLMLFNVSHLALRHLTPSYVRKHDGKHLHRFEWIDDSWVGELPLEWNWLVGEYPYNPDAKLAHYTLGAPCFPEYAACDYSAEWHMTRLASQRPQ
jgi:hypothetical protein